MYALFIVCHTPQVHVHIVNYRCMKVRCPGTAGNDKGCLSVDYVALSNIKMFASLTLLIKMASIFSSQGFVVN